MFDRQAKAAFFVVCVSLIVCGVVFRQAASYLAVVLEKQPVELRQHFATIPRQLGDWQAMGEDRVLGAAIVESLGTDQYLDRMYMHKGTDGKPVAINVHIAYYTGMIDAVPHVPDRCMEAGGLEQRVPDPTNFPMSIDTSLWPVDSSVVHQITGDAYPVAEFFHHVSGKRIRVHMPLGEYELRTTEFADPRRSDMRIYAGYFFIANNYLTPSPGGVKKMAFDPRQKYAYYCKVQFTMQGTSELNAQEFIDASSDLSEELLPQLMQCLPDWPEVESRSDGKSSEHVQG